MALDNTLCVHVDSKGYVTSGYGHHGQAQANDAASIRAVVVENPNPRKRRLAEPRGVYRLTYDFQTEDGTEERTGMVQAKSEEDAVAKFAGIGVKSKKVQFMVPINPTA